MLRSQQRYFIAFAGLILFAANAPIKHDAGRPPAAQANKEATDNQNIAADLRRIGNALEALGAKTDPFDEERNNREIRDLQAQEKSAYWAESMFWAAAISVLLSMIGIGLVWTTFRETRKANEIADDIGFKQLRAYVTAESAESSSDPLGADDGFFQGVRIGLHNSGSTPAISVTLVVNKLFVDNGMILHQEVTIPVPDIGSQARQSAVAPWYCWEDFHGAKAAPPRLIEGRITYVTVIPDPSGQVAEFSHPFKIEPKDGGRREAIAVDVVRMPFNGHF